MEIQEEVNLMYLKQKNDKLDAGAIGISTWVRVLEEGLLPAGEIESFTLVMVIAIVILQHLIL